MVVFRIVWCALSIIKGKVEYHTVIAKAVYKHLYLYHCILYTKNVIARICSRLSMFKPVNCPSICSRPATMIALLSLPSIGPEQPQWLHGYNCNQLFQNNHHDCMVVTALNCSRLAPWLAGWHCLHLFQNSHHDSMVVTDLHCSWSATLIAWLSLHALFCFRLATWLVVCHYPHLFQTNTQIGWLSLPPNSFTLTTMIYNGCY